MERKMPIHWAVQMERKAVTDAVQMARKVSGEGHIIYWTVQTEINFS